MTDACPACGREFVRSSEQNSKLHAMIRDIAEQKKWAGEFRSVETWKRLLIAAWMRATDRRMTMLPALDGMGFDVLYERSHRLSKSEMSELIEYVQAWAAAESVKMTETIWESP